MESGGMFSNLTVLMCTFFQAAARNVHVALLFIPYPQHSRGLV